MLCSNIEHLTQIFLFNQLQVGVDRFYVAFRQQAKPDRREDTGGEHVQSPRGFDGGVRNPFGEGDVKRDQENVGHGELAEHVQRGQRAPVQQVPLDQRQPDCFDIGSKYGEAGDD